MRGQQFKGFAVFGLVTSLGIVLCTLAPKPQPLKHSAKFSPSPARKLASATEDEMRRRILNGISLPIPRDCVIGDTNRIIDWSRLEVDLGGSTPHQISRNQPFPRIILIEERCRPQFESWRAATSSRYLTDGRDRPYFPFSASAPRPYCGTTPDSDAGCSISPRGDQEILVRVDTPRAPDVVADRLARLRNASDAPFPAEDRERWIYFAFPSAAYTPSLQVRFLAQDSGGDSPFSLISRRGTSYRETAQAYITYIHHIPRNHSADTMGWARVFASRSIDSMVSNLTNGALSRAHDPVTHDAIQAFKLEVIARASSLRNFWQRSFTYVDHHQPDFSAFDQMRAFSIDAQIRRSEGVLAAFDQASHHVVAVSTEALLNSHDSDVLLNAAAIWWAARDLRTQVGCNTERDQPFSSRESLVFSEYAYQACRRDFAAKSYMELSRIFARGSGFNLLTPEWISAHALTSRRERSALYSRVINLLSQQIRRNRFPSRREISMLAHYVMQTAEELRRSQVLTWKGFEPMSSSDETALRRDLRNFAAFFMQNRETAETHFIEHPAFSIPFYEAWRLVRATLSLPEWPMPSSLIDPRHLSPATISARLSSLQARDFAAVYEMYRLSQIIIANNSHFEPSLCSAWTQWLDTHRAEQPAQYREAWSHANTGGSQRCLALLPNWILRGPTDHRLSPEALRVQCLNGDTLSCQTRAQLLPGTATSTNPLEWAESFLTRGRTATDILSITDDFLRQMNSVPRSQRAQWLQVVQQIHAELRSRALSALDAIPELETYRGCINLEESDRAGMTASRFSPEDVQRLRVLCDDQRRTQVRNWVSEVNRMRRMMRAEGPFGFSAISPVGVYAIWLYKMKAHLRGIARYPRESVQLWEQGYLRFAAYTNRGGIRQPVGPVVQGENGAAVPSEHYNRIYDFTNLLNMFTETIHGCETRITDCTARYREGDLNGT